MNARELIERLSRLSAAQKELPVVVNGEEYYEEATEWTGSKS